MSPAVPFLLPWSQISPLSATPSPQWAFTQVVRHALTPVSEFLDPLSHSSCAITMSSPHTGPQKPMEEELDDELAVDDELDEVAELELEVDDVAELEDVEELELDVDVDVDEDEELLLDVEEELLEDEVHDPILPILPALASVNHILPSGPLTIPIGSPSDPGRAYVVVLPSLAMRTILPFVASPLRIVTQSAPSAPAAICWALMLMSESLGKLNSVTTPVIVMRPIFFPSVNQSALSGPAVIP